MPFTPEPISAAPLWEPETVVTHPPGTVRQDSAFSSKTHRPFSGLLTHHRYNAMCTPGNAESLTVCVSHWQLDCQEMRSALAPMLCHVFARLMSVFQQSISFAALWYLSKRLLMLSDWESDVHLGPLGNSMHSIAGQECCWVA
jgi:hypothetical protein